MINFRLIFYLEDRVKGWEGCLSILGIRGLVLRYRVINVEYINREGKLER